MASLWPFTLRYLPKPRPVKAVVCAFSVAIAICIYSTYPFPIFFFRPTLDESLLLTKYQYPSLNPDLYPLKPLKSECNAHNLTTASAVPSFPPIEPSEINEVTPSTVLLITASKGNRYWITIMEHLLVPYEVLYLSEIPRPTTSPLLDRLERPDSLPIGLIIFEDFAAYIALPLWQRHALDDYCRANKIGVIGFLKDGQSFSTEPGSLSRVGTLPLYLHRLLTHPWGLFVANNVSMLRITRGGRMRPGPLLFPDPPIQGTAPVCCQATLVPWPGLERYFVPLVFTRIEVKSGHPAMTSSCVLSRNASLNETRNEVYQSLVLEDLGLFDGIHRVLFAMSADSFWLNSMLILDAIVYLGRPSMRASPLISTPPYSPSYTPLRNTSRTSGKYYMCVLSILSDSFVQLIKPRSFD